MSGLAVVVDWQHPVDAAAVRPMVELIPHRIAEGFGHVTKGHAALAGVAATSGSLSIVGDLRLWDRDRLQQSAGGRAATAGMSDHMLILAAYRRSGIASLESIEGDFAFVIWDDEERRVVAARDRFAMKPLFYERTPSGIRFASEPKQLAATSAKPIDPCSRSIAEYLTGHYRESRYTFFSGIHRVRPSSVVVADPAAVSELRYWNPTVDTVPHPPPEDAASGFRDRLTQAVADRVGTSTATVSHLSGGLDSSAITAGAHIASERNELAAPFHTASAVFPGRALDESKWIDEVVARQPFPHHSFIPTVADVAVYDRDMWLIDQPQVNRVPDMWTATADVAERARADLVLAGIGGDEVLDQSQVFADRLSSGPLTRRLRDARLQARWSLESLLSGIADAARDAAPESLRRSIGRLRPRRADPWRGLVSGELRESLELQPVEPAPYAFDFPWLAQVGVVASTQHPSLVWVNEAQEAEYATRGLSLSQPYLDRRVVEYVASLPSSERPFDGRSKTLAREGFSSWLPASVVNRRSKTVADAYLDDLLAAHLPVYRDRYPTVSERAIGYIDRKRYAELLDSASHGSLTSVVRESLWTSWTLMAWLDGLDRYRKTLH